MSWCGCFDQERHPVSPAYPGITLPSFPYRPGPPITIGSHSEWSLTGKQGGRSRVTIDMLPDVALLEIFDFYMGEPLVVTWSALVHVCRQWRSIVFGSPRRLRLQLWCKASTPVRETLDVWPLLPIVVVGSGHERWGVGNILAALERNDRICQLDVAIPSSYVEEFWAVMQQSFPVLTNLRLLIELQPRHKTAPVAPASFLGGSAPHLQELFLKSIPFPGLPKLLLSATHLVHLELYRIYHSGYISPEEIVNCLSVLTRLERLVIKFESPQSRPDRRRRRPPPPTCTVLPVLTELEFKGASEYLEDLVARIDAPLLVNLTISFFHQLIFDFPQLTQFISRTPNFKTCDEAHVVFSTGEVWVKLPQTSNRTLKLVISCTQSDWQLSSLAQVCSSSFPQTLIPAVERLYIDGDIFSSWTWKDDIEHSQWLELFHPFTSVKDLHMSSALSRRITPALQELVGERATEVFPALQTIFMESHLSGPASLQETIGQFVVARQLSGHPISVSRWERY